MDKLGTTDSDETPSIGKSVLFAGIFGVVFLGPLLSALVYPFSSLELFFTPIEWLWPAVDQACSGATCAIIGLFGLYTGYSLFLAGTLTAAVWVGVHQTSVFSMSLSP